MRVLLLSLLLILVVLVIVVVESILLGVIVHDTDVNVVVLSLTDEELIRLVRVFIAELVNRLEDSV